MSFLSTWRPLATIFRIVTQWTYVTRTQRMASSHYLSCPLTLTFDFKVKFLSCSAFCNCSIMAELSNEVFDNLRWYAIDVSQSSSQRLFLYIPVSMLSLTMQLPERSTASQKRSPPSRGIRMISPGTRQLVETSSYTVLQDIGCKL